MDEYEKNLSSSSDIIIQMEFQKTPTNILYRARVNTNIWDTHPNLRCFPSLKLLTTEIDPWNLT